MKFTTGVSFFVVSFSCCRFLGCAALPSAHRPKRPGLPLLLSDPPEIFFPTHHPSKIRYPNKRAQNFSEMYEERGSRERGCAGVGATVLVTFENIMRHSRVDCQRGEGPDLCKILIDKQLNTINNIETERMRNGRDTIESE